MKKRLFCHHSHRLYENASAHHMAYHSNASQRKIISQQAWHGNHFSIKRKIDSLNLFKNMHEMMLPTSYATDKSSLAEIFLYHHYKFLEFLMGRHEIHFS